jgi:cell division protein FtsX
MRRTTQGSGLIIVLFFIAIFSTLVGVTFLVTTNNARLAKRTADHAAAVAHADGVIEDLFDHGDKP